MTLSGTSNGSAPQATLWRPTPPPPAPPARPGGGGLPREHAGALVGLAAVCVCAGAAAGLAGSTLQDKQYAARAELVYPVAQEQPTGFLRQDRSLSTQLVLIRSNAVLAPVAAQHDSTSAALRDRVEASVLHDSEVIRIQVRAGSREDATALTGQVLDSYRGVAATRHAERRSRLDTALGEVNTALNEAATRRAAVIAAAPKTSTSTYLDRITAEVNGDIESLRTRQIALQTEKDALGRDAPYVVTQPYALADQVRPRPLLSAAAGAAAGVLIALVAVVLAARRWTRPAG